MTFEAPNDDPDYPSVARTLLDGRVMRAIKIYHRAADLESLLRQRGWKASVREAGEGYLVGEARGPSDGTRVSR